MGVEEIGAEVKQIESEIQKKNEEEKTHLEKYMLRNLRDWNPLELNKIALYSSAGSSGTSSGSSVNRSSGIIGSVSGDGARGNFGYRRPQQAQARGFSMQDLLDQQM